MRNPGNIVITAGNEVVRAITKIESEALWSNIPVVIVCTTPITSEPTAQSNPMVLNSGFLNTAKADPITKKDQLQTGLQAVVRNEILKLSSLKKKYL